MILFALRYFAAVRLHPPSSSAVLGAVVAAGIWTAALDPAELDSGLGLVLLIQMFTASSGFAPRARQGHFDAVMTTVQSRPIVYFAHGIVSVSRGVAAWVALLVAGLALGSPAAWSALAGARAAALLIVSGIAWSAGFMLTRGAAGLAWVAALVGLLLTRVELLRPSAAVSDSVGAPLAQAAAILACPFLLLGPRVPIAPASIAIALGAVVALIALTIHLARRLDICLGDHT